MSTHHLPECPTRRPPGGDGGGRLRMPGVWRWSGSGSRIHTRMLEEVTVAVTRGALHTSILQHSLRTVYPYQSHPYRSGLSGIWSETDVYAIYVFCLFLFH